MQRGKVKGRNISPDSSEIATFNENHILNGIICDVEFEDEDVIEHMTYVIGENMLTRTNDYGHATMALQAMLNYRTDETLHALKDKHAHDNNQKKLRKSSQGWDLEVIWKDGTTDWLPLDDVKKDKHVEVAEHASARNACKKVSFNW